MSVATRAAVSAAVEAHLAAELADRYDDVVGTVATDGVVFVGNTPGSRELEIRTTIEEVRERYTGRPTTLARIECVHDLRTDWFVFLDCVATARVVATGEEIEARVASLFPALDPAAGINGEVFLYAPADQPTHGGTEHRARVASVVDYVGRLRDHDAAGASALFSPDATIVARSYIPGRDRVARLRGAQAYEQRMLDLFERCQFEALDVLSMVSDSWYVMAECELTIRDRASGARGACRIAEIYGFDAEGRIDLRLGYGTDVSAC